METDTDINGKQVIARAALVLRVLAGQAHGLTIAEITRASELPRSTAQRITAALLSQQMVVAVDGRFALGPAITQLAGSTKMDIVGIVRPHLEALADASGETANLLVVRGQHAVLTDQVSSIRELRVVTPVGTALPLYCTAHGKAFLAELEDSRLVLHLTQPWEKKTAHTLSSLAALKKELPAIRKQGFAYDQEEHLEGVSGVGLTLNTNTTERFVLSVVMPTARFQRTATTIAKDLLQCRAAIDACFS
jgi:IclR family acetate operon transcriptional repressor